MLGSLFLISALCGVVAAFSRTERGATRALAFGFLLIQFPLWMDSGQALCLRGHNLMAGCVLGLVSGRGASKRATTENAAPPGRGKPARGRARTQLSPSTVLAFP